MKHAIRKYLLERRMRNLAEEFENLLRQEDALRIYKAAIQNAYARAQRDYMDYEITARKEMML